MIVDNAGVVFSTTGTWTSSTNVPGYQGADYQWHGANGLSPDTLTIDNGGTGFSSTGTWTSSTGVPGYQGIDYQWYPPISIGAGDQLLDNGGPEFSATGQWTISTNLPGYQGANYQWHPTGVLPPSAIIIDNTDSQTSSVGDWYSATNVSGYYGSDYYWHDGAQVGSSFTWTPTIPTTKAYKVYARWQAWSTRATNATYTVHHAGGSTNVVTNHQINGSQWVLLGTFTLAPSSNHRLVLDGVGNGSLTADAVAFVAEDALPHLATWEPTITTSQEYDIYATWEAYAVRATDATYRIHHAGGLTEVVVDQTQEDSQWNYLGTYTLAPNEDHRIELRTDGNGSVIADAVLVSPVGSPVGTATWTPSLATTDQYAVYATWQSYAGRATDALYTIHHAGGSTNVAVDQTVNGSQWNLLGTFTMAPSSNHRVVLTESVTGYVIADGVRFVPVNGARNTATWTPPLLTSEDYDLYATWQAYAGRATDAPYTIHHGKGSTTVRVDQQVNGSQWNLLGTFSFLTNANHRIELTDDANGSVIADAVKLVPSTTLLRKAVWTPTIATSDSYLVYTRWTSHHNRATDATYTIHHQGGSSTVVVNQQDNGGEWQLLGTYAFDPSSNHRIELSDQANGTVVADAVYVVPVGSTSNNVTWEPTLASSQLVDVYAKWVEGPDRSNAATYTVHHAGGSTTINRNQRINGNIWNFLGRFTMNPASNHRVEVTDSTNGTVVADAVRLVSVTTSGAGLMYVHSDHLGTPQKMTDGTQAIVWDAVYEPFGETHSITGTASNNQRFPGQYLDAESAFHYNYFRDYDPSTGRYLQSDPIGLQGDLNTYEYVDSNSLRFTDPRGLAKVVDCGGGCKVRIESDPHKGKHAHWKCSNGSKGCIKVDGSPCDGSGPAPNRIRKCLGKNGFFPGSELNSSQFSCPSDNCPTQLVATTVVVGGVAYVVWKVLKTCGCTAVGGPIAGAVCLATP